MAESKHIESVTFVCNWNEGRSPHLELSTRVKLKERGSYIRLLSAGLQQGEHHNPLHRQFLLRRGISNEEIDAHKPTIFGPEHAATDLILVAELPMTEKLLAQWPELKGKIMTVKGFAKGFMPDNESITGEEAHIEDTRGHEEEERLVIYRELEELSEKVAQRLTDMTAL